MAENTERNKPEKNHAYYVTKEEFNRLKDKVDNHDDRIKDNEKRMEEINRSLTRIQIEVSPINQKIENLIQKLDFREERYEESIERIKTKLDEHKEDTENKFKAQAENISKLKVPEKGKNIFEFWGTSEGIMVAFISGGVAILTILIELIMK